MGVFGWLYNRLHPAPEPSSTESPERLKTAETAVQSALSDLRDAEKNAPMVAALVAESVDQIQRNHFGEIAALSMGRMQ